MHRGYWNTPRYDNTSYLSNYMSGLRHRDSHRYGGGSRETSSYYYGPRRYRPRAWERDAYWGGRYSNREETPKPEPPSAEIAKTIKVNGVYLHIERNTKQHRTDKFQCTLEGHKPFPELVLRRGDSFVVTLQLDRKFDRKTNDLQIGFSLGEHPQKNNGTRVEMDVDESPGHRYPTNEWGAQLMSRDNYYVTARISIPANCLVGEWTMDVTTYAMGGDETPQEFTYEVPQDITILFNPWCKDDLVYMEATELLEEYVLNESGCLYRGTPDEIGAKEWNFGQFEEECFDAAMFLLRKAFSGGDPAGMGDPVIVSRKIAQYVNAPDDGGVLIGKWNGKYSDGTSPSKWVGSQKILDQYMKTRTSVKYGQCWVFSGLTTTICRALGLPCRSVTCFSSAHDTDGSTTIDKLNYSGERHSEKDSIWNFHVWNEVWMRRPDLRRFDGWRRTSEYDGWQVIDATPQELSGAVYTCGPSSVLAIKEGNCKPNFDNAFVFAEVNADVYYWNVHPGGASRLTKIDKHAVGKAISTKIPDGQPYRYGRQSGLKRLDLTRHYKHPEGSAEERLAVKNAADTAGGGNNINDRRVEATLIELEIVHTEHVIIGRDMHITVKMKNTGRENLKIKLLEIRVFPETYIAYVGKPFFERKYYNFMIPWRGDEKVSLVMEARDYLPHLFELFNIKIEAKAFVDGQRNPLDSEVQTEVVTRFRRPDINVVNLDRGRFRQVVTFDLMFDNPLPYSLTNCTISTETTSGMRNIRDFRTEDVEPRRQFRARVDVLAIGRGIQTVTFSFDSRELKDVTGSGVVTII